MTDDLIFLINPQAWDNLYLRRSQNLSDLSSASTARTNLGLVAGGAGDIWFEKAGDEITGDVLFSGTGSGLAYGSIYCYDGNSTHAFTGSGIANKVQVTCFAVNGDSNNTTPNHTTDDITINKAGKYLITVSITAESAAGTGFLVGFGVYKNNGATLFQNLHAHRNLAGGGGDTGSLSLIGIIDAAVNDTIELWVWNETNTTSVIVDDVTMSLVQVGG